MSCPPRTLENQEAVFKALATFGEPVYPSYDVFPAETVGLVLLVLLLGCQSVVLIDLLIQPHALLHSRRQKNQGQIH